MPNSSVLQAMIFDLDGTLTDHPSALGGAYVECLKKYGRVISHEEGQAIARDTQRRVAGKESTYSYLKTVNMVIKEQGVRGFIRRLKFIREFIEVFHALTRKTKMYPEIPALLKGLRERGLKIGIVTSSNWAEVNRTFTEIRDQLEPLVDVIITREEVEEVKPNPECINMTLKKLGVDPGHAFMVGDSWQDIKAGKNAKTRTIAVLWGYGTRENLSAEDPDFMVETQGEILGIVDKLIV